MIVNEIFGPTLQGEGRNLGMPCIFLRLAACNLQCNWCDTKYTWDWVHYDRRAEAHKMELGDILSRIRELADGVGPLLLKRTPVRNLVVSGGEPLLQQRELQELIRGLRVYPSADCAPWWIEIETNGTIQPTLAGVDQWNVSPKLGSSGMRGQIFPEVLTAFQASGRAIFKFVVSSEADEAELVAVVAENRLAPVYIMPEGQTHRGMPERLRHLEQFAIREGYRLTPRLHVLMHDGKRKV